MRPSTGSRLPPPGPGSLGAEIALFLGWLLLLVLSLQALDGDGLVVVALGISAGAVGIRLVLRRRFIDAQSDDGVAFVAAPLPLRWLLVVPALLGAWALDQAVPAWFDERPEVAFAAVLFLWALFSEGVDQWYLRRIRQRHR